MEKSPWKFALLLSDIWNQRVLLPFRVQTNGVALTNWAAAHIAAEDATGNWGYLGTICSLTNGWAVHRGWRGLDPRAIWKLDVEFMPQPDLPRDCLHTFQVPVHLTTPMSTNLGGISLEISWVNQNMLSVEMPTNATNLRLLFVTARDGGGRDISRETGNWGQFSFWRALDLSQAGDSVEASIAIVPNVHVSYLVRPKLLPSAEAKRPRDASYSSGVQ